MGRDKTAWEKADLGEKLRRIAAGREQLTTEAELVAQDIGHHATAGALLVAAAMMAMRARLTAREFDEMFHLMMDDLTRGEDPDAAPKP